MRIKRHGYRASLTLFGKKLIETISGFPEHGMGYSLIDVTLFDRTIVRQVPVSNGDLISFYDDMRVFSESDILSVAPSQT